MVSIGALDSLYDSIIAGPEQYAFLRSADLSSVVLVGHSAGGIMSILAQTGEPAIIPLLTCISHMI